MWGQALRARLNRGTVRIIPTRVGTRTLNGKFKSCAWDHPHACGDKAINSVDGEVKLGSSPRVWGQDIAMTAAKINSRIIPTRVGTSVGARLKNRLGQDHPHACGDKYRQTYPPAAYKGSSPRVWGQVIYNNYLRTPNRIIPTRVGTSLSHLLYLLCSQDHPHACGDKSSFIEKIVTRMGSSPRVWGQAKVFEI